MLQQGPTVGHWTEDLRNFWASWEDNKPRRTELAVDTASDPGRNQVSKYAAGMGPQAEELWEGD